MKMSVMSTRATIVTLWLLVLFNMIFADLLGFLSPGFMAGVVEGHAEGVPLSSALLLIAALFLEVAIMAPFLTLALSDRGARLMNLCAAPITIVFIVGGGSLLPHYLFIATIEIAALLAIIALAWRWDTKRESGAAILP